MFDCKKQLNNYAKMGFKWNSGNKLNCLKNVKMIEEEAIWVGENFPNRKIELKADYNFGTVVLDRVYK